MSNRRDAHSTGYLEREKTRNEGIDLEEHPLFADSGPKRISQRRVPGTNDFLDLYDLR